MPAELSLRMVKFMRYKNIIIFFLIIGLTIFYPAWNPYSYSMSIQDETLLGKRFLSTIKKHFEFVNDDFALIYINKLGGYLAGFVDTRYFPLNFYIIKYDNLNAFAGPGGHIFIFTGMIEKLDSADQLAAIISHEIGHISGRHISQRVEQNKKIGLATIAGILAGILVGGKASGAIMTGTLAASAQAQLNYSREDERQADQLGFKYMNKSGFDPSAMIEVLKKIQSEQLAGSQEIPPYLLTHPGASERMSNIEVMTTGHHQKSPTQEVIYLRRLFPFFKLTIAIQYGNQEYWESVISKKLRNNPYSVVSLYGLGLVKKMQMDYISAVNYLKKADELSPQTLPILLALARVYQLKGDYRNSLVQIQRALSMVPGNKRLLFIEGTIYQQLEQYEKAIPIFKGLTNPIPFKDEVLYNLGICYGRRGELAKAHYYFGLYFKRKGMTRKAKLHFEKAKKLSTKESSQLKNKIIQELR